jgi:hypothetical protein
MSRPNSLVVNQENHNTNIASWKGNLNYWTGGVQGCKGMYGWCAGSTFMPLLFNLSWAQGEPELLKGDENCLNMRLNPNSSTGARLSDRNCGNRFILACQVNTTCYLVPLMLI